jgi:hypothetical protein
VVFDFPTGPASVLVSPSGLTVTTSGETSVTFTGGGAGVRIAVTYGAVQERDETPPRLSLARRQALEHVVNEALARLAVDLQIVLGTETGQTN